MAGIAARLAAYDAITVCDSIAQAQLILCVSADQLAIQLPSMKPFSLDFTAAQQRHRLHNISRKQEPLLQALAAKPGMHIIDGTAGTGRDSTLLAAYGCHMLLCERNPILFLLLENALLHAVQTAQLHSTSARMHLVNIDLFNVSLLGQHSASASTTNININNISNQTDLIDWNKTEHIIQQTDAIYLDPMFPERRKDAKVKKLAQVLHALAGQDADQDEVAEHAIDFARQHHSIKRVVIKRPRIAPHLSKNAPDHQIMGRSTRFDIYFTAK